MVRKPPHWAVQPHLTDAPTLWAKCKFFIVYQSGAAYNLVGKQITSSGNLTKSITPHGEGVLHSGRVEPGYNPMNPGTGGFSLVSFANPGNLWQSLITQRFGFRDNHMELRTGEARGLSWGRTNNGGVIIYAINSEDHIFFASSDEDVADGGWDVYEGSRTPSGQMSVFKNGENITDENVDSPDNIGAADFTLGGLPGTTALQYTRSKLWDAGFEPNLTDDERRLLGLDPWVMLRPRAAMSAVPALFEATSSVPHVVPNPGYTGVVTGSALVVTSVPNVATDPGYTGVVTGSATIITSVPDVVTDPGYTGVVTGSALVVTFFLNVVTDPGYTGVVTGSAPVVTSLPYAVTDPGYTGVVTGSAAVVTSVPNVVPNPGYTGVVTGSAAVVKRIWYIDHIVSGSPSTEIVNGVVTPLRVTVIINSHQIQKVVN